MSAWGSHECALSSSVDESLDSDSLCAPADSLGDFTLSPDNASVDASLESTDDSGTSHF